MYKKNQAVLLSMFFIVLSIPLFSNYVPAQSDEIITERNIRDIILERRSLSDAEVQQLDLNKDGNVDVADLICYIQINQPVKRYVGTMTFDSVAVLAPQNIELILTNNAGTAFEAEFNSDDSPFFSNQFSLSGNFSGEMPVFISSGAGIFQANDPRNPIHKEVSWEFKITETSLADGILKGKFTIKYKGVRYNSESVIFSGELYLKDQYGDETLLFENADDMNRLENMYGIE